jgi:hypothetical protein
MLFTPIVQDADVVAEASRLRDEADRALFWRRNTKAFRALADGGVFFHLVKDPTGRAELMGAGVVGRHARLAADFAGHYWVNHGAGKYVNRENPHIHVNSLEGYFSIFKRGMRGTYQHCAEKHLHRYLAEYDFRYNHRVKRGFDDVARSLAAVRGAGGKRLTYRQPH